ncbi:response regulator [uncultured Desulfosarcina sp.]|uniref:CBS domain-containing protein n=1 Tax=uncultured Desulfosarcina sp. TaxID=218289 RepID=UPI0029C6D210|nr:response regulator [uncultured Desulfosarcina sp.]
MTKKIKVLMVDDEAQFRETTRKLLKKRGFEVIMAGNGREALDQLNEQPDVVVLDVRMPDMDGNETLEEMQKQIPGLPVIMLTGHGADDNARQSLTQGAFDYLSKPCDIDILAARIADAGKTQKTAGGEPAEPMVGDVMIPLGEYTTITENQSVAEGIAALKASFSPHVRTSRILETGHRSLLVFNTQGKIKGILTIVDLLEAILPAYLTAPKPSTADSLQYSPMFWTGMFTRETQHLASTPVSDLMSPAPPTIDARANLMEAAYRIVNDRCRRLLVEQDGELVGVLREQDLFFQFERILP